MSDDAAFPEWERNGFAAPPLVGVAGGDEQLLRAYTAVVDTARDFVSRKEGQFFFVPAEAVQGERIGGFAIDRRRWTGAFLEQHLNAFVFGNAYERLGVWALNPSTRYEIGPIGFDTRSTAPVGAEPPVTTGGVDLYRHMGGGGGAFLQVRVLFDALGSAPGERAVAFGRAVRPVDDVAVILPLTTFVSDDRRPGGRH